MLPTQQVCGSPGALVVGCLAGWQGQHIWCAFFLLLYARVHTQLPFSPKRGIPTLVPLENTCYSAHKQVFLKALLGLVSDAFPRTPTGVTRTNFWPCHGKMVKPRKGVCHGPASDFPHMAESPRLAFTELTSCGTGYDHIKAQLVLSVCPTWVK